jgi:hypothetical protein
VERATRSKQQRHVAARVHVTLTDPNLILDPTDDDLDLAKVSECGDINAFEYRYGHTYPPGLEIVKGRRRRRLLEFRRLSGEED